VLQLVHYPPLSLLSSLSPPLFPFNTQPTLSPLPCIQFSPPLTHLGVEALQEVPREPVAK